MDMRVEDDLLSLCNRRVRINRCQILGVRELWMFVFGKKYKDYWKGHHHHHLPPWIRLFDLFRH